MKTNDSHNQKQATKAKIAGMMILTASILLFTIPVVFAQDWTPITPPLTLNDYLKVRTYDTYAMTIANTTTPGVFEAFFYNGTGWGQRLLPNTTFSYTYVDFDKATDGNFYWQFLNASQNYFEMWQYNPYLENWSFITSVTESTINVIQNNYAFSCIKSGSGHDASNTDADCYYQIFNGTSYYVKGINGATPSLTTSTQPFLDAGTELNTGSSANFRWNGVAWISEGSVGVRDRYLVDNDYKVITDFGNSGVPVYIKNSTSGTFYTRYSSPGSTSAVAVASQSDNTNIYVADFTPAIIKFGYFTGNVSFPNIQDQVNTSARQTDIDFDLSFDVGWSVGLTGTIYKFTAGTFQTSSAVPPNATVYNLAQYTSINPNITSIVAVRPITSTKTYALARTTNNLTIVSYDVSTPTSIIVDGLITPFNKQPRSLDGLGETILAGTNSNALLYNNTDSEDVTSLTLKATMQDGIISDDAISVYTATGDVAYSCDSKGAGSFIQYNTTTGVVTNSEFESCRDIASSSGGDVLYLWEGTSGIKIKNNTLNDLNTLNIISNIPTTNPTDALSTFGSSLAIITGRNTISIYDTTNPTSPTPSWTCRAQNDISAIEMLDSQKVIVATNTPSIEICNQNDTALYDNTNGYFVSKLLKSIGVGNVIDIRRNAQSLSFSTAETTQYAYYVLTTGTLATTNIAPVITSVTLSTNTLCQNQTLSGTINAYDIDTPLQLSYGVTCAGATSQSSGASHPEFTCSWDTAGTKTITAIVHDNVNTVNLVTSVFIQACSFNNFLDFQVLSSQNSQTTTLPALPSVLVNVIGQTSDVTDNGGYVSFNLATAGIYNVSFSKATYITQTRQVQTGLGVRKIYLESLTDNSTGTVSSRTLLQVIVKDENTNLVIPNALVSASNPIGGESRQSYTDQTGTANLLDVASGVNLIISASADTYVNRFTNTILVNGETKTMTILLNKVGYQNLSSGRGCQDYLKGFVLCSPLNNTLNGDTCLSDTDCIGGRCSLSAGAVRTCSQLNYTYCDERRFDRGTWCMINQGITRGGEHSSNWILDHLLYVLTFLIILGMILFAIGRRR